MKRNYKYNIGDKIQCKDGSYSTILEKTVGKRNESAYVCKCNKGHIYERLQTRIDRNCPYCSNKIIKQGINDISTTNKDLFSMLVDKDFGYTHCETSQEKTDFKCPTCKRVIYKSPYLIKHQGLCCPHCSDGYSYGEKFIMNLLNVIGVDYITQYSSKDATWCENYRYDFYIPSVDCIIEVHGLQHYEDCSWCSCEEVQKNDLNKKELAEKYVSKYIVLDVRYSTLKYIKQSILRSELDDILMLYCFSNKFTWKELHKKSISPIIDEIIKYYNNGITDVTELANLLKISNPTIVRYLKDASSMNLCDYDPEKKRIDILNKNHAFNSERTSKPIMCVEDGRVYRNSRIAEENSMEIYGKQLDRRNIHDVCSGRQKTTKGLYFKFISRQEFNDIKNNTPEMAFGDEFVILEVSA